MPTQSRVQWETGKLFTALLFAFFFFSAVSTPECRAQSVCPVSPVITSVTPSTWVAGQTYNITIVGTGFADNSGLCEAFYLNATLTNGASVPLSNVSFVSATQVTATVTPDASDPTQTACVTVSVAVASVVRQTASTNPCPAPVQTSS